VNNEPAVPRDHILQVTAKQHAQLLAYYSTYFLPNLYDYYLYTGDLDFVRQQWPSAEQELTYLKSITNAQGLLNVDSADALDWHPQDNQLNPGVVAVRMWFKSPAGEK
jgi:hypothetical protein